MVFRNMTLAVLALTLSAPSAKAQVPAEVELCRDAGLAALKKINPEIDQLIFDTDTLAISKADTKVEDTPVTGVIMGESYIRQDRKDKPNRFVCLLVKRTRFC